MVYLNPKLTHQMSRFSSFSPRNQRLTIGATGLALQTLIDATNPNVDDETRKYSAVRTAVKMVITTLGGITFREIGQKVGEHLVNAKKIAIPETLIETFKKKSPEVLRREYSEFRNIALSKVPTVIAPEKLAGLKFAGAVGWITAVSAAVVSVFIWDMPFVNKAMNFVMDKLYKDKPDKAH
ncbi:MAG: hypothetical protein ACD_20C00168G0002 [uncultured bacterium]|nr:MAG: hypothetical protein ACD_20C00168G0002 [uncultured bacterium]HBH17605.1 hypothetical protein [Cyanobacteria bacterium UBA9579]